MGPVGSQVDRYELLGELATGGMATVFLGRQRGPFGFTRVVAIKSMHPQYAKDPEFRAMFLDEATLTARIRHPNVVPTLDIVAADANVLIVMEYVEGVSLSMLIRRALTLGVRLTPDVASAIVCDLLHGLHAAHTLHDEMGQPLHVVHRDVSPQNVHVGADGLVRVLDFGVAKAASRRHVTQGGEVKGKLAYMSSEQVCGETVDHRTDVYAAGVVLWETLTQKRLIVGAHEGEMLRKVIQPDFKRPSEMAPLHGISPELDAVVMTALSAKKEDRFATANDMAIALAAAVAPAPRNAIAALVRDLAAQELESRSARLRVNRSEATARLAPELKMLAEVLTEHATVTRASTVSSKTVPPATEPSTESRAKRPIGLIVGGGVLVAAAIVGAFVVGTRTPRPAVPASAATAPPAASSASAAATTSAEPVPGTASAPAPVAPVVSVSAVAPAVSSAPKPVKLPAKPVTAKPDCRVKYTVDKNGDRHYKPECVD